jgi:hypothetical protein
MKAYASVRRNFWDIFIIDFVIHIKLDGLIERINKIYSKYWGKHVPDKRKCFIAIVFQILFQNVIMKVSANV